MVTIKNPNIAIVDNTNNKLPKVIDKTIEHIDAIDLYGATSIGYYAFEECRNLNFIEIPSTILVIENNAFDGCNSLPTITIPDTITEIKDFAFANCSQLKTVRVLRNTPPILGQDVFRNTDPTLRIYVPKGTSAQYKQSWLGYDNQIFDSPQ